MMKSRFLTLTKYILRGVAALTLLAGTVHADNSWYPSKYGADDTIGALNELNPEKPFEPQG